MEPETLRNYVSENRELETKLTKRNEQYIFDLKKSMQAANLSEEEQTKVLHEMLPVIVKEQKSGITARQLFGTVSERMEQLLIVPPEKPNTSPLMMWVDNTLLIFGLFGIVTGLMSLFTKPEQNQSFSFITLLVTAAVGGWVFYLSYKYIYQYEQPGADRSKRPKLWKTVLVLMASFFVWFALLSATQLLPAPLNFTLNPIITIVIGVLALLGRYYLKKKYNIVGSLSVPRAPRQK
ncbi:DUF1129 domain-containing protein [Enterococcus bulliens]